MMSSSAAVSKLSVSCSHSPHPPFTSPAPAPAPAPAPPHGTHRPDPSDASSSILSRSLPPIHIRHIDFLLFPSLSDLGHLLEQTSPHLSSVGIDFLLCMSNLHAPCLCPLSSAAYHHLERSQFIRYGPVGVVKHVSVLHSIQRLSARSSFRLV